MELALICIGDELLKGATVNTNMSFIGECLLEIGVIPKFAIVVPDTKKPLLDALDEAFSKADFVITTGGLGPTADDITKEVVAEKLGRRLYEDGEVVAFIARHWATLKRGPMPSRLLNQALVPNGAEVIKNYFGTAPGLLLKSAPDAGGSSKEVVLLPGPPAELRPMFRDQVIPKIKERLKAPLHSSLLYVSGVPESTVEDRMIPVISGFPKLSVAYCASPEYVKVFLTSPDMELLHLKTEEVMKLFPGELLSQGSKTLSEDILKLLRKRGSKLAVAESCTGGIIAERVTDVPGASDTFVGGVVAYSNDVKISLLGVSPELLQEHGAVSAECAAAMAEGVCAKLGADAGVAVTGIAGPDGGTVHKPVGLVYVAAKLGDKLAVKELSLRGGREQIRHRAASNALNLLRKLIIGVEP